MTTPTTATLIIPAHNAAEYLRVTLPAILTQMQAGWDVLVVDDASTDDTAEVARGAGTQVLTLPENTGPAGARNAGGDLARGDVLLFLDADVVPRADTLARLVGYLDEHPEVDAVFGSYDDDPAARQLVSRFRNLLHHYVHQTGERVAGTFWTGCSAIRRSVFMEIGPFRKVSITCIEDIDYGHRLLDAWHIVHLAPEIQCCHLKRWTLAGMIKTDLFQRAIPWTIMMKRRGRLDAQLNMGWRHRFSALAALAAALGVGVTLPLYFVTPVPYWRSVYCTGGVLGALGVAGLVVLQREFYGVLYRKGGAALLLAGVALHVLYYCYSVAGFVLGQGLSYARRDV